MAGQHDFNRDLNNYLEQRRGHKKNIFSAFKDEKPKQREIMADPEEELEVIEEEEEQLEERRESIIQRLFKGFRTEKEEPVEQNPEVEEDMKQVLKITFDWINRLPSETKIKFKESPDFVQYKAILKKYGLIKEVENAQKK
ncbi:hypothetical protein C4573_00805 [Candidatus Woesearchaeota archaeon]|nr:MAG: hypothetical protein C4573_00805 [Candidatus Woesearchaeota archaeon]